MNALVLSLLLAQFLPNYRPGTGYCPSGMFVNAIPPDSGIRCATPAGGGGSYTLPALTASVLGGVKGLGASLVCPGTDKMSGFTSAGAMICTTDQSSTYSLPAATVSTLGGVTRPSGTANGTKFFRDDWSWQAVPPDDWSTITSKPSVFYTLPDATAGVTGGVRLTGDLGGTATSPTVPGLAGKANSTHTHVASDVTSGTFTAALVPAATSAAKGGVLVPAADCNAATTAKVLYTAGTNTFSCGTDQNTSYTLPTSTTSTLGGVTAPASGRIAYGSSTGGWAFLAPPTSGSIIIQQTPAAIAGLAQGNANQALYTLGAATQPSWSNADKVTILTSDYTNATTTRSATLLTWTGNQAAVTRSRFFCLLNVKSSATTLGAQIDVTSSVAPTSITYEVEWVSAAGTPPSTGGTKAFAQATASGTAIGPTVGLTSYTIWTVVGTILHTASNATVTIGAKASGTGTITIGQGSSCNYSFY